MIASKFNVISVRTSSVTFSTVNPEFVGNIDIELEINSRYSLANGGARRAKQELKINVFPTVEKAPFRMELVMEGVFEWNEELNEEELKTYLEINGNAVLYSYARPIISQLTSFAGFATLILPLANFVDNDSESDD